MSNPTGQREALWAELWSLWHGWPLPTPESIDVADGIVWLPPNEPGQVDAWNAALGNEPSTLFLHRRAVGTASYGSIGRISVYCRMDLADDAAAHGAEVSA